MDPSTLRDSEDTTMQVQKPTLAAGSSYMPDDEHTQRLEECDLVGLLKRAHLMGEPVDLPQRESVDDMHSEYIRALSRKKLAVLALADVQVECEESEAVLLEAYGLARLKEIRDGHYVPDDLESATRRYFDAVSDVRFDPLEMYQQPDDAVSDGFDPSEMNQEPDDAVSDSFDPLEMNQEPDDAKILCRL